MQTEKIQEGHATLDLFSSTGAMCSSPVGKAGECVLGEYAEIMQDSELPRKA